MLRITVIQANGLPMAKPASHEFDERGGTIGRDDSNALALPDPDRHISRMQAQVQHDGKGYVLVSHGGNPTLLNGRPLIKGSNAPLRDGDEISIAGYTLRVELIRKASPFSQPVSTTLPPANDLLGLLQATPFASPPPMPPSIPPVATTPPPLVSKSGDDDPFAVFAPVTNPPPQSTPHAAPVDDPFANFAPRAPQVAATRTADPLGLGDIIQPADANSLNALFGLEQAGATQDPFANSPLGAAGGVRAPNLAGGSTDPLALLGGAAPTTTDNPARNDSPLLRDAFTPPRLIEDSPPPTRETPPPLVPERPLNTPQGGVVSWSAATGAESKAAPPPATKNTAEIPERIVQSPPPVAPPPPVEPAKVASKAPPAPPPADSDALLAAFARGIGLPTLTPAGGMTPELMEHVGRMLREAVQGTVELLIARAATKREVRATNLTMILNKNNNPLKFSPDVDFALMQLLLPQGSGFMKPDVAMRDAYDDLRAHQIGFVAGMRAALASVIGRFTPAELETQLADKSFLDSVLPANRKAKLWDLFEQRYSKISREAEDDFHSIFGREFLKAYEAQIEQLERDRP